MATPRSDSGKRTEAFGAESGWVALTWDDLDSWVGSRSVLRGRTYQRSGHVKDLRISTDGRLLATVVGTHRYATTVSLDLDADGPSFDSACTCPIGGGCKHAVAVVADYLEALANDRKVSTAVEEDRRWAAFESTVNASDNEWDTEDVDSWEEDEEPPVPRGRHSRRNPSRHKSSGKLDSKLEAFLREIAGRARRPRLLAGPALPSPPQGVRRTDPSPRRKRRAPGRRGAPGDRPDHRGPGLAERMERRRPHARLFADGAPLREAARARTGRRSRRFGTRVP